MKTLLLALLTVVSISASAKNQFCFNQMADAVLKPIKKEKIIKKNTGAFKTPKVSISEIVLEDTDENRYLLTGLAKTGGKKKSIHCDFTAKVFLKNDSCKVEKVTLKMAADNCTEEEPEEDDEDETES